MEAITIDLILARKHGLDLATFVAYQKGLQLESIMAKNGNVVKFSLQRTLDDLPWLDEHKINRLRSKAMDLNLIQVKFHVDGNRFYIRYVGG